MFSDARNACAIIVFACSSVEYYNHDFTCYKIKLSLLLNMNIGKIPEESSYSGVPGGKCVTNTALYDSTF